MGRTRYGVRDEIKDTAEAFYRAVSAKNLKAIDTLWVHVPYATVAGRSGEIRQGWEQVRRYWEQRFRQLGNVTVSARLTRMAFHAVGDVAWLSGTEIRTIKDGDLIRTETLRMTCVMEREGTGWRISSYHASQPAERTEALAPAS
jgi:ketosteroid isomerase-like protein